MSVCGISTSAVHFILGCFALFDAIVNEVDFLISVSDSLSLVYRNATGVHILVLHPVTLLTLLVLKTNYFLVEFSDFSIYNIVIYK